MSATVLLSQEISPLLPFACVSLIHAVANKKPKGVFLEEHC